MYAWDENGSALCGEWPGTKVTNTSTNDYGERIFTITVPENAAGIIVNNGAGAQTEDITDFCHYDGYWMDGTKNELGHYKVTGYPEYIPDPTGAEPTEGTTAQPQPCLYGFYNSQNFDTVYFYAWDNEGNATFGEWPGTLMPMYGVDEATGWQVYRFYVPAGTAGIVINDGKGRQTEDITTLDLEAYWLPGTKDSQDHYVVEEYKGQEMTTAEPDTQPNTEVEYDYVSIINVTNTLAWSQGYLYIWDEAGNALCGEWPGTKIKDVRTNEYGEEMFCCYIPADAVGMIVHNNKGAQTVDITDLSVDGYGMDGTTDEQGHYYVTGYDIVDDPTNSTQLEIGTEPTTVEQKEHEITLTNNFGWTQAYMYAWDEDGNTIGLEWPGTPITEKSVNGYGEEMFICQIPANAAGIIVSNGSNMQTEDITDFTPDGYWMDGTQNDLGHYRVKAYTYDPTDPTETTEPAAPGSFTLGDVTGDGIITVADATMVQEYAAEMRDFTPTELAAADTNRDGIVTVADATLIQQYAAEMIDKF